MSSSMSDFEKTIEIAPDSKFTYFDSRAPSSGQPYTTFVFVHGALFHHRNRGYKYASPFAASDSAPEQIRICLGHDLASIVTGFSSKLDLLSHPKLRLKLLSWSVGAMSLLSTYQLLYSGQLSPENEETLNIKVTEIIAVEATTELLLGRPALTFTAKYHKDLERIYHYEPKVLENVKNGIRDKTTVYPINESLADDPAFIEIITLMMDAAPLRFYQQAATPENAEGRAYTRECVKGLLKSGARIAVLSTKHCVPDYL
ncbi:hypothetical protein BDZ45DRAFT_740574 [Acephala macrosclerotiorum]|nr:hypothetical protein BDZ45DRAFT_740574 [Acephala macrosclerotiorum]